jgi:hypothetical protein
MGLTAKTKPSLVTERANHQSEPKRLRSRTTSVAKKPVDARISKQEILIGPGAKKRQKAPSDIPKRSITSKLNEKSNREIDSKVSVHKRSASEKLPSVLKKSGNIPESSNHDLYRKKQQTEKRYQQGSGKACVTETDIYRL